MNDERKTLACLCLSMFVGGLLFAVAIDMYYNPLTMVTVWDENGSAYRMEKDKQGDLRFLGRLDEAPAPASVCDNGHQN